MRAAAHFIDEQSHKRRPPWPPGRKGVRTPAPPQLASCTHPVGCHKLSAHGPHCERLGQGTATGHLGRDATAPLGRQHAWWGERRAHCLPCAMALSSLRLDLLMRTSTTQMARRVFPSDAHIVVMASKSKSPCSALNLRGVLLGVHAFLGADCLAVSGRIRPPGREAKVLGLRVRRDLCLNFLHIAAPGAVAARCKHEHKASACM